MWGLTEMTPRRTLLLMLVAVGCRQPKRVAAVNQEEEIGLRSLVHTADVRSAVQLVKGFHEIEQNSWRWTQGSFSVTLRPPSSAAAKGATLVLQHTIPDAIIAKVKKMTLTANIQGATIPSETYSRGGSYTFRGNVPAVALASDAVTVDFAVDNFVKAGEVDARELAMIVVAVGLELK